MSLFNFIKDEYEKIGNAKNDVEKQPLSNSQPNPLSQPNFYQQVPYNSGSSEHVGFIERILQLNPNRHETSMPVQRQAISIEPKNVPIEIPEKIYVDDLSENDNEEKDVTQDHIMKQTFSYAIKVPGHKPRVDSDVFRETKRQLIDALNTPCYICGSKEGREIHHFHLEMSLENAVDWDKMKQLYPDFPYWYKVDSNNPDTFKYFTDDKYNMMVLCKDHHVMIGKGIHCLPYPIWQFLKVKKDNYDFLVNPT